MATVRIYQRDGLPVIEVDGKELQDFVRGVEVQMEVSQPTTCTLEVLALDGLDVALEGCDVTVVKQEAGYVVSVEPLNISGRFDSEGE
jgi:hypothetical protein